MKLHVFALSGQYSCTFLSNSRDVTQLLDSMEESGWSWRAGFRQFDQSAVWYEFFCDAVTMPVEVRIGSPDEELRSPFHRAVRFDFVSKGEPFFFWSIGSGSLSEDRSFTLPSGRYTVYAFSYNPVSALDELALPPNYRETYEYHRFVFLPEEPDANQQLPEPSRRDPRS